MIDELLVQVSQFGTHKIDLKKIDWRAGDGLLWALYIDIWAGCQASER